MPKNMNTKEYEEHRKALKKVRKTTAIATVAVIFVLLLVFVLITAAYTARINDGEHLRREIAASSQNTEIDGAVMSYYFRSEYNSFLKHYGNAVNYFGLNTSLSLKKQEITEGVSWHDYFMNEAKNKVTNIIALNEAASEEDFVLTEDRLSALSRRVDSMDMELFGNGISRDDVKSAEYAQALAYGYQYIKELSFMPDQREIEEKYAENPKYYQYVDYYSITIFCDEQSLSDMEGIVLSKADAQNFAQRLVAAENLEAFKQLAEELISNDASGTSQADIDMALERLVTVGARYTEGNEVAEWAFSAKVEDTYVKELQDESAYTVYMLTAAPYRRDDATVNARHILLCDSTYGSRGEAISKAEKIVETFEKGERTAESFALLALEFSEDETTRYSGGYYGNVMEGETSAAFNDWCFSPGRQGGDVGIVDGTVGCHIIFYEGKGLPVWQSDAARAIVSERLDAFYEALLEKAPVLFDESVLEMITE